MRAEERSLEVERANLRVDRALADLLGCGRRQARRLIAEGRVLLDGHRPVAGERTRAGSRLSVAAAFKGAPVSFEDACSEPRVVWRGYPLLAVSKPAGVHSERGRSGFSVDAFLDARESGFGPDRSAGVLHRIDRDTSGLLLATADEDTYRQLRQLFGSGRVEKQYLAIVAGQVSTPFVVDIPLARRRTRVVRARRGDRQLKALTEVSPLDPHRYWSLVLVTMRTGVTHQVRAHLSLSGHPLVGDAKYGGPPAPAGSRSGQLLHALRLRLPGGPDIATAAAPDFSRAYASLRVELSVFAG